MHITDTHEARVHDHVYRQRSHGNRKDQRFRRQCRARGMKSDGIKKMLKKRKQTNLRRQQQEEETPSNMETNTEPNVSKRKREDPVQRETIPTSTSSVSLVQPTWKKMKKKNTCSMIIHRPWVKMNDGRINKNYRYVSPSIDIINDSLVVCRRPMYLKRAPMILFQMLTRQLNYPFKLKHHERQFIHDRLTLFDRQYCVESELKLQQSLLTAGLQRQCWPVSVSTESSSSMVIVGPSHILGSSHYDGKDQRFHRVSIIS